jgi:hypothetical protein
MATLSSEEAALSSMTPFSRRGDYAGVLYQLRQRAVVTGEGPFATVHAAMLADAGIQRRLRRTDKLADFSGITGP